RALAVTVGTGLSLGAGVGAATAQEVDLGWEPTASQTAVVAVEQEHPPHGASTVPETVGPGALDRASNAQAATAPLTEPVGTAQGAVPVRAEGEVAASGPTDPASVVVAAGDTLWGIARAHLGPDATTEQVAQSWPAWHEENREVIGADPDLIRAGQVLAVPTTGGGADAVSAAEDAMP
uniref:LysM peptidoglycan-binding domain-containing protein n=1 Tax=Actinotalea sp. C106 TaxID=2908644 RepID=UPI00202913F9